MSISPLSNNAAQSLFSANTQSKKTDTGGFSVNKDLIQENIPNQAQSHVVSISNEGLAYVQGEKNSAQNTSSSIAPNEALKQYAIPGWLAEKMPNVNVTIGEKYSDIINRNARFNQLSGSDEKEYFTLLNKHYQELLKDNDINTTQDHYQSLIANKETSEKLRLDMEKRIAGDNRLTELLAKLGPKTN